MASTTCGWCEIPAHMTCITTNSDTTITDDDGDPVDIKQDAYTCDNCGRINIATFIDATQYAPRNPSTPITDTSSGPIYVEWTPEPHHQRLYPDVPDHVASAATEATLCQSVGAHRAVGSLARAVIEATAKDKGADGRDLKTRIDNLTRHDHVKDQAHEIRIFGNDMAHGDFTDPTTAEEAAEILELMDAILDEVYQSPAKLARRRTARLAKKTTT